MRPWGPRKRCAGCFSYVAEGLWWVRHSFLDERSLHALVLRLAGYAAANGGNPAWRRRVRRFHTGEASILADEIRVSSLGWAEWEAPGRVEWEARGLEKLRALSVQDQFLLALRVDHGLSWEEIAKVLSRGGRAASADTLRKRFERLKARILRMARDLGLMM